MAGKRSKKERSGKFSLQNRRPDLDMDLISNLPTDVYNAFLLCLPIKEAVRTSVLSRKWRHRWASIPHLVFKNLGKEVVDIVNGPLSPQRETVIDLPRPPCVILGSLHHIEKLELHGCSLQFFSISNVPDVLPNPLLHLKNLSMNVSFDAWKEVFTTLCMLRSSPNLEKLEFEDIYERRGEPDTYPTAVFWEAQEHLGCSLNHLRTVKMCRNIDEESALCFIRFILVNAPVLETMSFVGMAGNSRFLMDLLQLRRASPQAIIRCK